MPDISRRCLVTAGSLSLVSVALAARTGRAQSVPVPTGGSLDGFPRQLADRARQIVGASHRDIDKVKQLLDEQPDLAKATWDWGFGDWESAIDAASHTGRREIALLLMEHGARPTVFTHVMLGHLDVVRATIAAQPGIQRTHGPHGISMLRHAKAGGDRAAGVLEYLVQLGDADAPLHAAQPISPEQSRAIIGTYAVEPARSLEIEVREGRNGLEILETGGTARILTHLGDLVFHPAGCAAVRIAFKVVDSRAESFAVTSPAPWASAIRKA